MQQPIDILIIGGGIIGACLMAALKNTGYRCVLVETKPPAKESLGFDARSLALSPASQRILEALDLWPSLAPFATAIDSIHTSEKGAFGAARLQGTKAQSLGYVLEMQYLQNALYQRISTQQLLAPATLESLKAGSHKVVLNTPEGKMHIEASLIVAADGANSLSRQLCNLSCKTQKYHQSAIIANVGLAKPHRQQAFERFTADGPLAMLPLTDDRAAMVWTVPNRLLEKYLHLSDSEFLLALQKTFGYRLGRFKKLGQRVAYPLQQTIMPQKTVWPVVFIGNAAQTLHPVAGQGFNLGLRDVATLAQGIKEEGLTPQMLTHYEARRKHDQQQTSTFTHGLVELFGLKLPGFSFARNAGLLALDNLPFLKKTLIHYASGFGGYIPDLVCKDSD